MKKRRHIERAQEPRVHDQLFRDIVAIIEKYAKGDSVVIPDFIKDAGRNAVLHQKTIRITDTRTGDQIAIVPAHWIPLLIRLETCTFSQKELVALDGSVFDEEHTPEKRSKEIVAWARGLK